MLFERYADVAIRRWQRFTGKDAIFESSGQTFDCAAEGDVRSDPVGPKAYAQVRCSKCGVAARRSQDGFAEAGDKRPKKSRERPQWRTETPLRRSRTSETGGDSASSRRRQRLWLLGGMRGGPGRTRTSNQTVMSGGRFLETSIFCGFSSRAAHCKPTFTLPIWGDTGAVRSAEFQ
jgi:hypothetical protein